MTLPDTTIRDKLATDLTAALDDHIVEWCCADHPPALEGVLDATVPADRLLAKGWRPPARVITSVEEAEALPRHSIVLVLSPVPRAFARDFGGWYVAGPIRERLSTVGVIAGETAILLWQPEVGTDD